MSILKEGGWTIMFVGPNSQIPTKLTKIHSIAKTLLPKKH